MEVIRMRRFLVVVVVVVVVMVGLVLGANGVEAQSASRCKKERRQLVNACESLVYKKPPSASCCKRLRVTSFKCVCPVITPSLALLIDVNYAAKVVRGCGRRLPRHFKCGSITLP